MMYLYRILLQICICTCMYLQVELLDRCKSALVTRGVIVVKENVTSSGKVEKDEEDSSVTRHKQDPYYSASRYN